MKRYSAWERERERETTTTTTTSLPKIPFPNISFHLLPCDDKITDVDINDFLTTFKLLIIYLYRSFDSSNILSFEFFKKSGNWIGMKK